MDMLVLAGGFGTRLKDVVSEVPKAMAPINGIPLLQLQLEHWVHQGQRSFVFLLYHQAEIIIELLKKQSIHFGSAVSIDWIVEDTPLGTGGSVSNAIYRRKLTGSVLITNADTWLDGGLQKVINTESAVIGVIKVENTARYGSIYLDTEGYLTDFVEKKQNSTSSIPGIINAGLYKLPTSLFWGMDGKEFSLENKILSQLSSKKLLQTIMFEGDFFDIGIPMDYYKFCEWYRIRQENSE